MHACVLYGVVCVSVRAVMGGAVQCVGVQVRVRVLVQVQVACGVLLHMRARACTRACMADRNAVLHRWDSGVRCTAVLARRSRFAAVLAVQIRDQRA